MAVHLLSTPAALGVATLLVVALYARSLVAWNARARGRKLPPGPQPLPIVGNMFNMPTFKPWFTFRDLSAKYGNIMHFTVLGETFVVLNDAALIDEYLEKRSANTSDRTQTPLLKISGHDIAFAFMPHGPWWRRHRRAFWQHFNYDANLKYQPIQRAIMTRFLNLLLDEPVNFVDHISFTFGASILKVVYGISVTTRDNVYLQTAFDTLDAIGQIFVPGKWLMESLPILQYVPTWLPGTGTQRLFKGWKDLHLRLKNTTFDYTKDHIEREDVSQSIVAQLIDKVDPSRIGDEEEEEVIKNVGAIAFLAGADTSFGTLQGSFLALSLHPEVAKKAQAELEAVVGPHRLPDFGDQDALPYVNAIVLESLRWHNVLPLAIPHRTTDDDEFQGYFIPAGTSVIPNSWACLHDPEVFPDPDVFRPERFIRDGKFDAGARDPRDFVFGYGRRVCPGRHFALSGLFLNLACVLHVFDLSPPLDNKGRPIDIKPEMSDGFLSHLEDCRCTIKPRSAAASALIRAHAADEEDA